MATAVAATPTNNPEIDGLLGGARWSGTITYSFPDSPSDYPASYYGNNEPNVSGFSAAPVAIQQAITYAVGLIASYTNATFQFAGTNGADIAIAQSPAANPTAYAYYPYNVPAGGDIWFGNSYNYSQAQLGNYFFVTALHELGHAIGLKHSQEAGGVSNVAVPAAHDHSEYTVMSYRSYAGAPLTGYTAEAFGYAQTYMANDILALQTLYGADFTTRSENTVYTWSSTTGQQFINGVAQLAPGTGAGGSSNRIFETVWDGDGIDTYDFSNYATALRVNLNPGASSTTSATQIANLGNGYYASGNVYNAYLFNGDARSYIDNALGGSGNDSITGNAIANNLSGGGGNDTLTGAGGNDTVSGGSGTDTVVFSGNRANYLVSYNAGTQTFTVADQRGGTPDGIDTVTGVESFQFSNATYASSTLTVPNQAPVVTIPSANVSASAGQVIAASSLFSITDANNDVLTYFLYDSTANGGRFVVNGATVAAQTVIALSAYDLARTTFVAGPAGSSDAIAVMAYDGQAYSGNTSFSYLNVNVAAPVNAAPVVTIPSANVSASAGQVIAASSLFSISDANNDVLTYFLYDSTANGGRFVVNGATVAAQTVIALSAYDLARTTFVAGPAGSSDAIAVLAYDGQAYSGNTSFSYLNVNVAAPAANQAPVVTIPSANVSASAGQVIAASSLFSVSDANNDVLTYFLYDATANGGHFVVNGTTMAAQTVVALSAWDLARTTFVAGPGGSTDSLAVLVYDGQAYSGNTSFSYFNVNVAGGNQAPVVTIPSANVSASAAQSIAASSLFSVSDANNDVLTYFLYDATANGGHFVINGATVAAQTVVALSAWELARTTFVAGPGGSSDNLRVMAYDGQAYSGNTSFSQFNVNVASAAGPVAGEQATSGDNFVFAGELGQKAVTDFSPVAVDIYAFESPADRFNQIYGADIAAPSHAKADFGVPDAAIDLFALFGMHATDQTKFVF